MDSVIDRVRIVTDGILKQYENSGKRVLLLVSTHAAIVKAFSVIFGGGETTHEWCYFCAFSGIEINGKDWRLIFDEESSHIKARL